MHIYVAISLSPYFICQFTYHPSIHLSSIYLHLFTLTFIQVHRFIHNYIYSFRHSSIHPQSHSFKNQSIISLMDPLILSINSNTHPTRVSIYPVTDSSETHTFHRTGSSILKFSCDLIPFSHCQEKTAFYESNKEASELICCLSAI